jgi:hypothetical protein
VDNVDPRVVEQRLEGRVRVGQVLGLGLRRRPLGTRADDAGDFDAQPPERLDMDDADEARTDDRRSDVPK